MNNLYLYLLEFLALTSVAAANPFVSSNTSNLANTVANQTGVGIPDPRFHIEMDFRRPIIPLISCLMNTVQFLAILALEDFWGSTEKFSWKLSNYPEVGMIVSPNREGGRIERRFVIWGLSEGVADMIRLTRFQAVTFALSCEYSLRRLIPGVHVC